MADTSTITATKSEKTKTETSSSATAAAPATTPAPAPAATTDLFAVEGKKGKKKIKKSALPRKVAYFILYVPDMTKAVEFYRHIGLKMGHGSPEWTEFKAGIKFALHAQSSECASKASASQSRETGICFAVKNCDKTYAAFQRLGVKIKSEPTQVCEDGRSFSFEDPFGNILSVYGK